MKNESRWIAQHQILAYVIIAYGFTWFVAAFNISARLGWGSVPGWLHYAAAFGPLVGAFTVTAWTAGWPGLKELLARLVRVRFAPIWWAAALSPLIVLLLVDGGVWLVTGSGLNLVGLGEVDGVGNLGVVGTAVFWLFTFGLGEETGWRGFLLHHLDQQRPSRNNPLIVGLIWAAWHLPFFFYQENFIALGFVGLIGWVLGLMAGSVLLAWIYRGTGGSILAVMLWHALFNLGTAAPMSGELLAPVLSMAVIVTAVIIRTKAQRQASYVT
ncbi:MAG: CPBP family intramembrane metalloprotease [Ardenticatenaceae bacterium]|nr:CPBP family intramembrane metalloprotease [Ardenticatenaceae bacterium]